MIIRVLGIIVISMVFFASYFVFNKSCSIDGDVYFLGNNDKQILCEIRDGTSIKKIKNIDSDAALLAKTIWNELLVLNKYLAINSSSSDYGFFYERYSERAELLPRILLLVMIREDYLLIEYLSMANNAKIQDLNDLIYSIKSEVR